VVDSHSTDSTPEIARQMGATVVEFDWNGRYPRKRQWALENLPHAHDYVLYLDADEEVTPDLADEIARLFANGAPPHAGYFVRLAYSFLGRELRHGQPVLKLVLLDRRRSRFLDVGDDAAVTAGDVEVHNQPHVDGPTGALRTPLRHDDHEPLFHFFDRHNRWSDWEALLLREGRLVDPRETHRGTRGLAKRMFHRLPLKPIAFFLVCYVLRLGFLDGRAGFHYAIAKSMYYWQVGVKVRELELRRP
jgi:glycosyltransferase involved in cell wall biosynthesis